MKKGIDDERLDFSTAGTSPIKEARQAINDGKHRLDGNTQRRLSSILVTPQQPPFKGTIYTVSFGDGTNPLALNKEDYAKLQWLMAGNAKGRGVVLAPTDDRKQITIRLDGDEG